MAKKPGPESNLTEELTLKIRELVLQGALYKDIQARLEILSTTWDQWVYKDYKDFRKNLNSWKAERLIKKSERLSEEILDMKHKNSLDLVEEGILRVKQKESEFIRKTLGKEEYSDRSELTGKDGKDLIYTEDQISRLINKIKNE